MVRDIQPLVSYEERLSLVFRPVVSGFCMVPSQQLHLSLAATTPIGL